MGLAELEIERRKLAGAAQDRERSSQQRQVFAEMLSQLDHEVGQKRSAGIQVMCQAANAAIEPPQVVEQAAPVVGMVRRTWRSPVVHCDWEPVPFVPREVTPYEHPIATLGIDMEAMRAAHEHCAAVLARSSEG